MAKSLWSLWLVIATWLWLHGHCCVAITNPTLLVSGFPPHAGTWLKAIASTQSLGHQRGPEGLSNWSSVCHLQMADTFVTPTGLLHAHAWLKPALTTLHCHCSKVNVSATHWHTHFLIRRTMSSLEFQRTHDSNLSNEWYLIQLYQKHLFSYVVKNQRENVGAWIKSCWTWTRSNTDQDLKVWWLTPCLYQKTKTLPVPNMALGKEKKNKKVYSAYLEYLTNNMWMYWFSFGENQTTENN